MKYRLIAAIAAASLAAGSAQAASIVNGSFEDGPNPGSFSTLGTGSTAITGWTVGSGSVDYIGSYWTAQDGGRSLDLAGNAPGSIYQDFATTAGLTYEISFYVGRNPDGGQNPRTGFVDLGGTPTAFIYSGTGNRANMQWQLETFRFSATGANTRLTFAADPATANGFYGAALDNVSIATVPEPATWALFILGFGAIGGALRRSRPTRRALIAA